MAGWFETERVAIQAFIEKRVRQSFSAKFIGGVVVLGLLVGLAGIVIKPVGKVFTAVADLFNARTAANIAKVKGAAEGKFQSYMTGDVFGGRINETFNVEQTLSIKDCEIHVKRRDIESVEGVDNQVSRDLTFDTKYPLRHVNRIRVSEGLFDSSLATLHDVTPRLSHQFEIRLTHDIIFEDRIIGVATTIDTGWENGTVYGDYNGHEKVTKRGPALVETVDDVSFVVRSEAPMDVAQSLVSLAKQCGAKEVKLETYPDKLGS